MSFLILQHLLFFTCQSALHFLDIFSCWKVFWDDATFCQHFAYSCIVVNMFLCDLDHLIDVNKMVIDIISDINTCILRFVNNVRCYDTIVKWCALFFLIALPTNG